MDSVIEARLSNGDAAEAGSPEEAVFAARVLMGEAAEHGAALSLLRVGFFVGGRCVASGLRYRELGGAVVVSPVRR